MKINLSIRGGAADGLGYVPFFKELTARKDVTFGTLSGTSFGAIASAMISHGWTEEQMKKEFLSFVGDRYMKMEALAEKGHGLKRLLFIPVVAATKLIIFPWIKRTFNKKFSWKKITRAEKVFLCFISQTEMASVFGFKFNFSFLDLWRILKTKDGAKLADRMRPYYASDDGIYSYRIGMGFYKVSNKIMSMGDAVIASFWNPIFQTLHTPMGEAFDGGLVNNEGNLAQQGKDFYQIACQKADMRPAAGDKHLNSIYYNHNRPADDRCFFFPPLEDYAFFQFDNLTVKKAWDVPASCIIPKE